MSITVIHTADIHGQKSRMDEALASLDTLRAESVRRDADLIAISGDIWNAGMYATGSSRFPEFIEAIRQLADVAPVVMVYGTPSHDLSGSLEVFRTLDATHSITVLEPGTTYFLEDLPYDSDVSEFAPRGRLMIFGIPEPAKDWLLAGKPAMGREESDAAMKEGMRKLLLGLAATRKQHSDIPCLVLYHGQIRGATMQNGQVVENAIGRDDLAMIGADYYALGDIHEPQQIGDLPMYYPGSAYPQNWGETHQAGFNVVTIRPESADATGSEAMLDFEEPQTTLVEVERVDYPHPQRMKIETDHGSNGHMPEVTGRLVWHEITAPKGVDIDTDALTQSLRAWGALPGSRVTVKVLPTETVRAGSIAEQEHLADKLHLWATNTSEEVTDSVLQKARELEQARAAESIGASHHWRITKLSLRGAIGIWKGLGVDEITFDLDKIGEGIIALVGANGKGKTTLFENMQPWPQLVTRDGTLQSHFRLRDSHRDLYLRDELTGDKYRFFLQINGAAKSGGVEYHVYKNGVPFDDSNGRKDPYLYIVESLFGTLEMYQRSAFVSQRPTKGNPDLADATKGERKVLFRELAGLDYLQEYTDAAKARAKAIADQIQSDEGWIDATRTQVAELPAAQADYREREEQLVLARQQVIDLEERGKGIRAEYDAIVEAVQQDKALRTQRDGLVERDATLRSERYALQQDREKHEKACARREDAEERIRCWEELNAEKRKVEDARNEKLAARTRALEEYNARREDFDALRRKLEETKRGVDAGVADLQRRREAAIAEKERLGELLDEPRHDTCPACGTRLPWADDEAGRRDVWKASLEEQRRTIWQIDKDLVEAEDAAADAAADLAGLVEPEPPKTPRILEDDELQKIERDMAYYKIDEARATLEAAKAAGTKTEAIDTRLAAIAHELVDIDNQMGELAVQIDDGLLTRHHDVSQRLEAARQEHTEARERAAWLESQIDSMRRHIETLETKKAELVEREEKVASAQADAAEWVFLQRACGPDGIQALELDALAPSISTVANSILESAYGSRFMVDFQTTKMSADGKKQLEDFLIQIYDTEHGTEQELSTLSGGEAVWIKRAIYDAFGIIRDRNTGLRFLSAFQDETDGALDPEAKEAYARMLETAHRQAGRTHTILITHSREVQELVGQRIEMDELAEVREEVGVA